MESPDLLLVNINASSSVYQSLSSSVSAIETPFLAALTAGFVRKNGYGVKILDAIAEGMNVDETVAAAAKLSPRLIHIIVHGQQPSASTQLMTHVGAFCKDIKATGSQAQILLTGTHPSALPERTMKDEVCDFVGQGEGFLTVLDLLQRKGHCEVRGLWHKHNSDVAAPKVPAPDIKEADMSTTLSDVAWDLLPRQKYRAHNWQALAHLDKRQPYGSLYTSFGCPYRCTFCCINAPFERHTIRCFSAKWAADQIQILSEKYGTKYIKIIDEMFVLRPNHVAGITKELVDRGLNNSINSIWAYARVDTLKEEFLVMLKKAKINWLVLGIESGSKHVRDGVEKGRFTDNDIIATVRKAQAQGINIMGNYIFGLPDDTLETMNDTLNLAIKANCEWANFYSAMAYPGSELYAMAKQKGLPLPDDAGGPGWIGYSQHAYETLPLPTGALSAAQVLKFRDYAYNAYFTNPQYADMLLRKFGDKAIQHIDEMNKIKLRRRL